MQPAEWSGASPEQRAQHGAAGRRTEALAMLEAFAREVAEARPPFPSASPNVIDFMRYASPETYLAGRLLLETHGALRSELVCVVLERVADEYDARRRGELIEPDMPDMFLAQRLVEKCPRLHETELLPIVELVSRRPAATAGWADIVVPSVIVRSLTRCDVSDEVRVKIGKLHGVLNDHASRGAVAALERLQGEWNAQPLIEPEDDWGRAAAHALEALPAERRAGWEAILRHAATLSGAKPSKKWNAAGAEAIAALGAETFARMAIEWLRLLSAPARNDVYRRPGGLHVPTAIVSERNSEVLKGLAWCCALAPSAAIAHALGDALIACYHKIPEYGARCTKGGNACIAALGALPNLAAVAQLQRAVERVKLPSAQKLIDNALNAAAALHGLSRADLEDLAIPTFDLVDGVMRVALGADAAELLVGPQATVELRFLTAGGNVSASPTAAMKRDFADELKTLKQAQKDLRALFATQRSRLEGLYLAGREWSFGVWRERMLEHAVLQHLARRLIWSFDGVAGAWDGERIVGLSNTPLAVADDARVRLWHPLDAPAADVLAWRAWLEQQAITQPFKQAHREIYVLTDAERATGTYSNRFAAHILRQHQLSALCRERGWLHRMQGGFDGGSSAPTLSIPNTDVTAELWVEPLELPADGMSHAGLYLYVSTDQVRFSRPRGILTPWGAAIADAVPLDEVPPLIFSEVMRDVDLFVGVCGIGADPTWHERAGMAGGDLRDYWFNASFGELSGAARTRHAVLAQLLPRMTALAGRWELGERYLSVRGQLRTYRIHIGSGNILMEPNSQYLCIVPGRGPGSLNSPELYLPFEGDQQLAVIISKALLLASDDQISDAGIARQIRAV